MTGDDADNGSDNGYRLSIAYAECPRDQYERFEHDLLEKFGILDRKAVLGMLRSLILDVVPARHDEVEAVAEKHGITITSRKAVPVYI